MTLDRRTFLKAGGAAGAVLLARPFLPLAATEPDGFPVSRASRLFDDGTVVVHSDLHNHSLLSDGQADPDTAFEVMRAAGLDVAALTDHAILGHLAGHILCPQGECTHAVGINRDSWERKRVLADAADEPDAFTAIRGFEWTSGHHGHVNVWFTDQWTDPLVTGGLVHPQGLANFVDPDGLGAVAGVVPDLLSSMDGFYEWLRTPAEDGGGADGLASFNHPNAWGNFEDFRYEPAVAGQVVACEILNGTTDYLFYGREDGHPSPINACLNAGWRVGMLGVSDEHGTDFGMAGKGRGGLWVSEWSRQGVYEALAARRFFATSEAGLRLDAAIDDVRMGGRLQDAGVAPSVVRLDIAAGAEWVGRPLSVQVLRPGPDEPAIAHVEEVVVPGDDEPVISFEVAPLDPEDGAWVLVRITDPEGPPDPRAPEEFAGHGRALAYPSPFFLG